MTAATFETTDRVHRMFSFCISEIKEILSRFDERADILKLEVNTIKEAFIYILESTQENLAGINFPPATSETAWPEILQSWNQACRVIRENPEKRKSQTIREWLHRVLSGLLELDIEYRVATQNSYMIFSLNCYARSRDWKQKLLQFFKPPVPPKQANEWLNPFKVIAEISLREISAISVGVREHRVVVTLGVVRRSRTGKSSVHTELYPFGAQLLVNLSRHDPSLVIRTDEDAIPVDDSSFLCEYRPPGNKECEAEHSLLQTTAQFDADVSKNARAQTSCNKHHLTVRLPLTVRATSTSSALDDLKRVSQMLHFSGSLQCTLLAESIGGPPGLFQNGIKWSMNTNFLLHRDQDVLLVQSLEGHSRQSPYTS
eukprot:gb/GECG01008435.1/.p1 GENE.gb/GECG01008435.1/~~gb/GECG01008435.1/.p1  ORF type:complete len:372 (+),score=28.45 gb/GECG01008435.1/:1-1116(+)